MAAKIRNIEVGDGVIRVDFTWTEDDADDVLELYAMVDGDYVTIHDASHNTLFCRGQFPPDLRILDAERELALIISDESNIVP